MPTDLENAQQETAEQADSAEEIPAQPPLSQAPEEQPATDAPEAQAADSGSAVAEADPTQSQVVPSEESPEKLQRLLSMQVPVIVKVAQKKITIGKLLQFHMGSIIQFDKDAYQQLELMVNNSTMGLGQPIKIGEKFGLRITQVGDIADTIKSLSHHKCGPDT